jgi:hypothetical protein
VNVEPSNAQAKSGLKAVEEAIAREAAEDGQDVDFGLGKVRIIMVSYYPYPHSSLRNTLVYFKEEY